MSSFRNNNGFFSPVVKVLAQPALAPGPGWGLCRALGLGDRAGAGQGTVPASSLCLLHMKNFFPFPSSAAADFCN